MAIQVFIETLHYHTTSPAPFLGLTTVFRLEHTAFDKGSCFCCTKIGDGILKDISVALPPEHVTISSLTKLRMVSLLGLIYTTEHALRDPAGYVWVEDVMVNNALDMAGWKQISSMDWPIFLGGVLNDDVTIMDPQVVRNAPTCLRAAAHAAVQPDPTIDPWDLLFS